MAKRDNNYSQTQDRVDYKKPEDIDNSLNFLEEYGKLPTKKVLPPKLINDRCNKYYDRLLAINEQYINDKDNYEFKAEKQELQHKIINLSSIVIGSVIKRFKTLYPKYYQDVFTDCVLDVLLALNRGRFNKEKSSYHSYCYETSY